MLSNITDCSSEKNKDTSVQNFKIEVDTSKKGMEINEFSENVILIRNILEENKIPVSSLTVRNTVNNLFINLYKGNEDKYNLSKSEIENEVYKFQKK